MNIDEENYPMMLLKIYLWNNQIINRCDYYFLQGNSDNASDILIKFVKNVEDNNSHYRKT